MSKMIEQVERALAEASVSLQDSEGASRPTHLSWDDLGERERKWFRAFARAAITAMREPTNEMKQAGKERMPVEVDYWLENGRLHCKVRPEAKCVQPESIYTAMIDRALTERESGR